MKAGILPSNNIVMFSYQINYGARMSAYEDVVKIAAEFKTFPSLITALGKVRAKTEDSNLIASIDALILELQRGHAGAKNKSMPVCMEKFTLNEAKNLLTYCKRAIGTKKPEWQILAERHGWAPRT
ncbi:hypothetical protein [Rheinheimera oceanensis]|uniref:hypothetical protein n=1 Tax=Rheinheimera oceanensis TaxID=2817449 RepID=UPI001BFE38DC|nr:hypothetical protein [Rheinheimera oceanensis]